MTIRLRLIFLDQDAGGTTKALHLNRLPDDTGKAVTVTAVTVTGPAPGFMEQIGLQTLFDIWFNSHLDQFQHVFATVDVNAAAASAGFEWLRPTHVDYAYVDRGPDDGILAILCMTEGRAPTGLPQQVSPGAILPEEQAGFLIAKRRVLDKLLLPIMPRLFPFSGPASFALSDSHESIVTTSKDVSFLATDKNGRAHHAELSNFELSLVGSQMTLGMTTTTDVSPGIKAICNVQNFLGLKLVEVSGRQTLGFYETQPQAISKSAHNDTGFETAEIILTIIAVIALAIATIATAGTALAVAALVIGLLAGAAAGGILLTKTIIDDVGTANAPSIDALLINATAPITWTGSATLRLTSAGFNDSVHLGGKLVEQ